MAVPCPGAQYKDVLGKILCEALKGFDSNIASNQTLEMSKELLAEVARITPILETHTNALQQKSDGGKIGARKAKEKRDARNADGGLVK